MATQAMQAAPRYHTTSEARYTLTHSSAQHTSCRWVLIRHGFDIIPSVHQNLLKHAHQSSAHRMTMRKEERVVERDVRDITLPGPRCVPVPCVCGCGASTHSSNTCLALGTSQKQTPTCVCGSVHVRKRQSFESGNVEHSQLHMVLHAMPHATHALDCPLKSSTINHN